MRRLRKQFLPPADVLAVSRGLDPQYTGIEGRDLGYATRRTQYEGAMIDLDGSNPTNPLSALHLRHHW